MITHKLYKIIDKSTNETSYKYTYLFLQHNRYINSILTAIQREQ